jgi:transcriptional regulator with XRE-family HTH domain
VRQQKRAFFPNRQRALASHTLPQEGRVWAPRLEAGLPRAELARRAGVPVSTLRNWENGRGFPSLAAGLRLAGVLGVPVERIADGVEDPAEDEPDP